MIPPHPRSTLFPYTTLFRSSKHLEADFVEVHNRLALTFYQADDGDNAIGEARTALSMDFDDGDAYRMLGLGHYANQDRKSTRLNSSHVEISYAVFCLKKKNQ